VRIALEVQFRGFQVALTDDLDLLLEELRIFLGRVQPVLAAMRLQLGRGQRTIDLTRGDGGDDFAADEFISEFSSGPIGNGPIRFVYRFTGDG
jgi:hypothetical protein